MAVNVPLAPPPPGSLTTSKGGISDRFYQWLQQLQQSTSQAAGAVNTVQGQTESETFSIAFPSNQDYDVLYEAPYGFSITNIKSRSKAGSCTATFKINGTALGGTANSVSTSGDSKDQSSANVLVPGDILTCTISSASSCQYAIFTFSLTRT